MNFAKLTDAQTGNPILIRLDDVQAVTETVPGMKPEGRRLFCRGSVLVVKETAEDIMGMVESETSRLIERYAATRTSTTESKPAKVSKRSTGTK